MFQEKQDLEKQNKQLIKLHEKALAENEKAKIPKLDRLKEIKRQILEVNAEVQFFIVSNSD